MPATKDFKAAQKQTKDLPRTAGGITTSNYDPKKWETACEAIEAAYPELQPDVQSVINAGKGKTGEPVRLATYKGAANRALNLPARNVVLYSSGKAVWTNLAQISL